MWVCREYLWHMVWVSAGGQNCARLLRDSPGTLATHLLWRRTGWPHLPALLWHFLWWRSVVGQHLRDWATHQGWSTPSTYWATVTLSLSHSCLVLVIFNFRPITAFSSSVLSIQPQSWYCSVERTLIIYLAFTYSLIHQIQYSIPSIVWLY